MGNDNLDRSRYEAERQSSELYREVAELKHELKRQKEGIETAIGLLEGRLGGFTRAKDPDGALVILRTLK